MAEVVLKNSCQTNRNPYKYQLFLSGIKSLNFVLKKMNSNIILVLFSLITVTFAVNHWQSAAQPEWGPPEQQWKPPQAEYNPERCASELG